MIGEHGGGGAGGRGEAGGHSNWMAFPLEAGPSSGHLLSPSSSLHLSITAFKPVPLLSTHHHS